MIFILVPWPLKFIIINLVKTKVKYMPSTIVQAKRANKANKIGTVNFKKFHITMQVSHDPEQTMPQIYKEFRSLLSQKRSNDD